jgi:hypothetical protein
MPFAVLFTSSMAELSGALPSVLMATWANIAFANRKKNIKEARRVFMGIEVNGLVKKSQGHRVTG